MLDNLHKLYKKNPIWAYVVLFLSGSILILIPKILFFSSGSSSEGNSILPFVIGTGIGLLFLTQSNRIKKWFARKNFDSVNHDSKTLETIGGDHQALVEQYNEAQKLIHSSKKKSRILAILSVAIVAIMNFVLEPTIFLHVIAASCVVLLFTWHFWGFRHRRSLDRKLADSLIAGISLEEQKKSVNDSFFQKELKKFNILEKLGDNSLYDILFLVFLSISVTQFCKLIIDPEIITTLAKSTPIRTIVICALLYWAYYRPFRSVLGMKKKLES